MPGIKLQVKQCENSWNYMSGFGHGWTQY